MLHDNRNWCLGEVASAEELTSELTAITWCPCQAFRIKDIPDYLWLNDSTSPDGAQEFAVVRIDSETGTMTQIESLTISWMNRDELLTTVLSILRNQHDAENGWTQPVTPMIQSPKDHGRCHHCA